MKNWKDWFLLICVVGLIVCGFFLFCLNDRVDVLESYHNYNTGNHYSISDENFVPDGNINYNNDGTTSIE